MKHTKTLSKRWRKLFCDAMDYHEDIMFKQIGSILNDDIDEDVYVMVQDIIDLDVLMKFDKKELLMLLLVIDYVALMLVNTNDRSKETVEYLRESELFMKRHNFCDNIQDEWNLIKNEESLVSK